MRHLRSPVAVAESLEELRRGRGDLARLLCDDFTTVVVAGSRSASAGARGAFSDMLDALVLLLHDRARQLVLAGHERQARRTAQGVVTVLNIKEKTLSNVSPQLLAASLVNSLHTLRTP